MADSKYIIGTCRQMCPEREINFRERNNLLHWLEIDRNKKGDAKADSKKVVKEFSRSAAGKAQLSPSDLRPSDVLLTTVDYLINDIIPNHDLPFLSIYDFVNDRLQAVRQDITIQMIEDNNSVKIFEKCIRFYIIASYVLCEEPPTKFDQHLNSQQLSICLEKLFVLYRKLKSDHLEEFIGIHFCQNVVHTEIYYRSVSTFSNYILETGVKNSMATCIAYIDKNFVRFFKLLKQLPLILMLCFFHHIPHVRKEALESLNVAFSSNSSKFPVDVLSSWLSVSKIDSILQICQRYNVKIDNNNVCFNKKNVNILAASYSVKPTREEFIDSKLEKISLSNLINGFC